jgi:hypothetical protein
VVGNLVSTRRIYIDSTPMRRLDVQASSRCFYVESTHIRRLDVYASTRRSGVELMYTRPLDAYASSRRVGVEPLNFVHLFFYFFLHRSHQDPTVFHPRVKLL